jgi:hypothetical protein
MSRTASPPRRLVAVAPRARREPPAEHSLKCRLVVLAQSTADVVRFAGGWLADQGLAGWEVSVLTADRGDPRLLRILGARGHDLDAALASSGRLAQCVRSIAVQGGLYESDAQVRRMVLAAQQTRSADVRLWGEVRSAAPGCAAPVHYRVSLAARAFKAQALAALRMPAEAVSDIEVFRGLGSAVPAAR